MVLGILKWPSVIVIHVTVCWWKILTSFEQHYRRLTEATFRQITGGYWLVILIENFKSIEKKLI